MRNTATRKADVLAALEQQGEYWLASADLSGRPHVIAVSGWWDGHYLVVTTLASSVTARNLRINPIARLAGGTPSDAIVVDVEVIDSSAAQDATELAQGFEHAMGWDPSEMDGWTFFRLRPSRIQAFRGYDEIGDRDVMVRSRWLA